MLLIGMVQNLEWIIGIMTIMFTLNPVSISVKLENLMIKREWMMVGTILISVDGIVEIHSMKKINLIMVMFKQLL